VNDAGVTFALINWYSVPARVARNVISRGQVTRSVLASDDVRVAEAHLADFPLGNTNPFRLIGIFPEGATVVEWQWNLSSLQRVAHAWKTNIWVSSGFDEPGAQKTRYDTFVRGVRTGRNTLARLRALHASHAPSRGPYSICMHRADAASVSYTEIEVDDESARLTYAPGPPCQRTGGRESLAVADIIFIASARAVPEQHERNIPSR